MNLPISLAQILERRPLWQIALASAVVLWSAFPPLDLRFLVLIGLVPWFAVIGSYSVWKNVLGGAIFGYATMFGQLLFVQELAAHWTGSIPLSLLPWFIGPLLGCVPFAAFGGLACLAIRKRRHWLVPLLWVGLEVFRSYVPVFAFPWGFLASPLWPYPVLLGGAHYFSIFGLDYGIASFSALLAYCVIRPPSKRRLSQLAAPIFVVIVAGVMNFARPVPGHLITVTDGQPGVDTAFGDPMLAEANLTSQLANFTQKVEQNRPDLYVLPEGVTRVFDSPTHITFPIPTGVPTLFGAQRGRQTVYQSAFSFDGHWHVADKTRLVIFGEFVPGRDWIPFLGDFHLPTGDLTAAKTPKTLAAGDLTVGPILCFEALFPDIAWRQSNNGAHLLAVMSDDDFFMGTPGPEQLFSCSIFRAIETGLPVVRSASTGYTALIDSKGVIAAEAPLIQPDLLTGKVLIPTHRSETWSLWLVPAAGLLAILAVFWPSKK